MKYNEAKQKIIEITEEKEQLESLINKNEIGVNILLNDFEKLIHEKQKDSYKDISIDYNDIRHGSIARDILRDYFMLYPFEEKNLSVLKKSLELIYLMYEVNIDIDIALDLSFIR